MISKTNLNNGRYLLFLDLLGFSKLVKDKSPQEAYDVIDSALQSFSRWEELNKQFKTIYFSDTFLFYQYPKGYGDWAFLDIYAIGATLLSALLAKGISARGSITFGEFEVKVDSSNNHQLYFGKALIEAYEAERREQWIGITIQPSAWKIYERQNSGIIKVRESEHEWKIREEDEVLLLNPFRRLCSWYEHDLIGEIHHPYMEWDMPEFPNDILGFRFLVDNAATLAKRGDFSRPEAVKYHATLAFLKEAMGIEIFEWGLKISDKGT